MPSRLYLFMPIVALLASGSALAQTSVRTETIRPPAAAPSAPAASAQDKPADPSTPTTDAPEIITDLSRLPPAVAQRRERLLAAARAGDLAQIAAWMRTDNTVFTFSKDEKDPIAFWKSTYPDSDGIEVLSILIGVLETGFLRVDEGTPQETYVWPYFVHMPIRTLTLPQKVELFRIVTGADYKDMVEYGAYAFYRVGIATDGTWRFFVAGD